MSGNPRGDSVTVECVTGFAKGTPELPRTTAIA